jgi:3-phosphoshikimate 1-carboxyvinyltransferase
MNTTISQSNGLRGTVQVPGDKSISHRAFMISALATGTSEIHGYLDAADPRSTMHCMQALGIDFRIVDSVVIAKGKGLHGLRQAVGTLDSGNSGTTMRLMTGILAGQPFSSTIAGDESLNSRPMKRIIDPLTRMGATIEGTEKQTAPLRVTGRYPLTAIDYQMEISSAQVKSAVLLAGLFADGTTRVTESTKTRDHTERLLGLSKRSDSGRFIVEVKGGTAIAPQRFQVPGDVSSAAFLIAAALLVPHSELRINNVGLNPTRSHLLEFFRSIGGSIDIIREETTAGEPIGDLLVRSSELHGSIALEARDVAELIDEIPILAITAAASGRPMTVHGAADLRNKESDRIHSLVINLRKLGLDVDEYADGFAFQPKNALIGAECDSYNDHRIAMAFGVAGLALQGKTVIRNSECVGISFPAFW